MDKFFISEVKPYNFSHYLCRLDAQSEVKEIFLSTPLSYSPYVIELIIKLDSSTLYYKQVLKQNPEAIKVPMNQKDVRENETLFSKNKSSKNKINKKEENKKTDSTNYSSPEKMEKYYNQGHVFFIEPETTKDTAGKNQYSYLIKKSNYQIPQLLNSFITSIFLPFVVYNIKNSLICLSRVEDDICNMCMIFRIKYKNVDKLSIFDQMSPDFKFNEFVTEEKFLMEILMEPSSLLGGIEFIEEIKLDKDTTGFETSHLDINKARKKFEEITAGNKGSNCILNATTYEDSSINKRCSEDNEVQTVEDPAKQMVKKQNSNPDIHLNPIVEDSDKSYKKIKEPDEKPKTNINNAYNNSKKLDDRSQNSSASHLQNQKNNQNYTKINNNFLDTSKNNLEQTFSQLSLEQRNTTKFGRINGKKMGYGVKQHDKSISLTDTESNSKLIALMLTIMDRYKYDVVEMRGDMDIFIRHTKNGEFIVFLRDQVCKDDINTLNAMSGIKDLICLELSRYFKKK
ncbi:hypothetical protein EDEG_01147 [Edhazardia aedis USNM 41457]|uniref:Uncharacterized protein n=1 Tax=Edhazardia aedis (strain USNM 41457) TaxID=1003232 RepID=J9DA98_EDHAE|nr:hypothetical protein EDEG_01147 [Edhazardia aedis USNM 41457]|eukprot:EJW04656.1 hypothetical protein EDEG_01147 [Edhazardia aedis USNM 41457]